MALIQVKGKDVPNLGVCRDHNTSLNSMKYPKRSDGKPQLLTPGYCPHVLKQFNKVELAQAVTSSMGCTGASAKKTKVKMFSMLLAHGLPSVLFTSISPEDLYNYMIWRVMVSASNEVDPPVPKITRNGDAS